MLIFSEIKEEDGEGECDVTIRVDMFINSVVEAAKILSEDLKYILDNARDDKLSPKKKVEIIAREVINDTDSNEEVLSTNKTSTKDGGGDLDILSNNGNLSVKKEKTTRNDNELEGNKEIITRSDEELEKSKLKTSSDGESEETGLLEQITVAMDKLTKQRPCSQ